MEEWKPIDGFEGYEVSSFGRVKGIRAILIPQLQNSGYYTVGLYRNRMCYRKLIHRLVGDAFLGKSDKHIDHINRNKLDNNITNLRWATRSENNINKFYKSELGLRNIRKRTESAYEVKIYRNCKLAFYKYCSSLEEAIKYRDSVV